MRIVGFLILVSYLILLLTGIYCTFAANVPEPPERQSEFVNKSSHESSESNESSSSPGSVFGSFIFFPYPVIAPNNPFGQMIRNFFRNNTFGAGWVPLPMLMSVINSTKPVAPNVEPSFVPAYPGGFLVPTSGSCDPPSSTPPIVPVNPNNESAVNARNSTA